MYDHLPSLPTATSVVETNGALGYARRADRYLCPPAISALSVEDGQRSHAGPQQTNRLIAFILSVRTIHDELSKGKLTFVYIRVSGFCRVDLGKLAIPIQLAFPASRDD